MGTHPIFESDFDCLTDSKYTYNALSMSSVNELISKISAVEKKLKESGVFIPPPAVEYDENFKQRDKLTGNTKSVKKKLKNAQSGLGRVVFTACNDRFGGCGSVLSAHDRRDMV